MNLNQYVVANILTKDPQTLKNKTLRVLRT